MTAHKNVAMIKAKADNMSLVVFRKHHDGEWLEMSNQNEIAIKQNGTYFLCLPQHKEVCLHWLSGGYAQDFYEGEWETIGKFNGNDWTVDCAMMDHEADYRIKPRKEKRWVLIKPDGSVHESLFNQPVNMLDVGKSYEIEVEI